MAAKKNPLNLNALQLKTLTIFQVLAELEGVSQPLEGGDVEILELPWAHGTHFHLGPYIVGSTDATGLRNPAPWTALDRKGLIRANFPVSLVLTRDGAVYDTGMREKILIPADHGI